MRGFLSYAREEAEFAVWFRGLMARADPGLSLWMDDRLDGGAAYAAEIEAEVDRADVLYAAVSPASVASAWCRREWERAVGRTAPPRIVPLLIADVDVTRTPLAAFQVVDLRRWRIDGDRAVREGVGAAAVGPPAPATAAGALRRVLAWAARSDVPTAVTDDLLHAAGALGAGLVNPVERARLLDAIAGLHLTRRGWRAMEEATRAALESLAEAGWTIGADDRSDAELGFFGELHARLALAARQRGDPEGRAHAERALRVFRMIRQPLERDERAAQAHRELGTHAQLAGEHDRAREHFRESGRLLVGVPSQALHVAQAAIKEAQLDLADGDLASARLRLDGAAARVDAGEGLLVSQVRPHLLITEAACLALEGRDDACRAALDAYVAATVEQGRNRARWIAVRALLWLPRAARGAAVRAALTAR